MNLSTCEESRTDTGKKEGEKMCQMSHVTYYLSPTPTATVTDTPPAMLTPPPMHSRLVCEDKHFGFEELAYLLKN